MLIPEWHQQQAVMLTWPHGFSDWRHMLKQVEEVFVSLCLHITRYEQLILLCYDKMHCKYLSDKLKHINANMDNISFYIVPTNDTWCRDYGPLSVNRNGKTQLLDFQFNAWGEKYDYQLDNSVNSKLYEMEAFTPLEMTQVDFIAEGGSIESDGNGTIMTSTECLIRNNRNKHMTQQDIEAILKSELGAEQILWLEHGHLPGDDTDAHIDTLARFCDENTIAYVRCDDPSQTNVYEQSQLMEQHLRGFTNAQGKPYKLIPLPYTAPIYNDQGKQLPGSYANFLIINEAVLAPIYDDKADNKAIEQLRMAFPNRKIIPIPSRPLIQQFGSIHCLAMQIMK